MCSWARHFHMHEMLVFKVHIMIRDKLARCQENLASGYPNVGSELH